MPGNEEKLGSGLDALFGTNISDIIDDIQSGAHADEYGRQVDLYLDEIHSNPYQPRQTFDDDSLEELAQSIREHGVFTPVLVRKVNDGYELIAGERRVRASELAGNTTVPAIIVDFTDEQVMEISLLENIQRENLNVIDEANAYKNLMERRGYTQEVLAQRVGKSREHIANTTRLLRLPEKVQKMLEKQELTAGQVRPLITVDTEDAEAMAERIAKEGMSAREIEKMVRDYRNPKTRVPKTPFVPDSATLEVEKKLQHKLQTKVKITGNSINISYGDTADLNRILELLGYFEGEN